MFSAGSSEVPPLSLSGLSQRTTNGRRCGGAESSDEEQNVKPQACETNANEIKNWEKRANQKRSNKQQNCVTQTPLELSPRELSTSDNCSGARPLVFQELRVPQVGYSPVRVQNYERSPYRGRGDKRWGHTWGDDNEEDGYSTTGIHALQEKINLLKNHPSEIFNFMVVSGSPRLGKEI